jgi:hypothetical protein
VYARLCAGRKLVHDVLLLPRGRDKQAYGAIKTSDDIKQMIAVSVERHRRIAMTLFHDDVFCPFVGSFDILCGIAAINYCQQSDACCANDG